LLSETKRLSGIAIDVVQSELIQISSRLITETAAKTDDQVTYSYGGNVLRKCCNFRFLFCHDSLENVASIDSF